MKKGLLLFILACVLTADLPAEETAKADNMERLIFTPTAGGMNYGEYNANFRMYKGGGMLTRAVFGVLQGFNVGFSWNVDSLIGSETAKGRDPNLYLKMDLFRGNYAFPKVSLGYDRQGYEWRDSTGTSTQKYRIEPIGFFLVMTKELFFPNFFVTGGANYNKDIAKNPESFRDKISSFAGFSFKPSKFGFCAEGINLGRGNGLCRFNAGAILQFTEGLEFMLNFENITRTEIEENGLAEEDAKIERALSIIYRAAF
ncbi:MAG: hypothetical protein ABIH68_05700 [bacterium]